MLPNETIVAKIGFDTAESGLSKLWATNLRLPLGQTDIYVHDERQDSVRAVRCASFHDPLGDTRIDPEPTLK